MKSTGYLCRPRADRSIVRALLAAFTIWIVSPSMHAQSRLALLAAFDGQADPRTVEWMEQETAGILSEAGLAFLWRETKGQTILSTGDVSVWVRLHGSCRIDPSAVPLATDGPMAWVQSQDGEILPFIDVDCDRTAGMVWQNRHSLSLPLAVRAFGRALGRVVAHELYHYVTQSAVHTKSDLASRAMTSQDLMAPKVRFESAEIEALDEGMRRLGSRVRMPTD